MRKAPKPWGKKAVEAIEHRIVKLNASVAKADEALSDTTLFRLNPLKAADLGKQKARALAQIQEAEAEWMEAAERYEAAKRAAG